MELARSAVAPADKSFSLVNWYGTLGGAALSTDPDPNVTPPTANRIVRVTPKRNAMMTMGSAGAFGMLIRCVIADGTNMTVRAWLFDDSQNKWVPEGNTTTITFATTNVGNVGPTPHGNLAGCKLFMQITANTGCTVMGVDVC